MGVQDEYGYGQLRVDVREETGVKTYGRDQILQFLAEIDELLGESVAMEIIGGAAALLAYGAQTATKDIDSFVPIDARISRAAMMTSRRIPLDRAAVADPSWNTKIVGVAWRCHFATSPSLSPRGTTSCWDRPSSTTRYST